MKRVRGWSLLLGLGAAAGLLIGSVVSAQAGSWLLQACVRSTDGTLMMVPNQKVPSLSQCPAGFEPTWWNQFGPAGPVGAQGPAGPPGVLGYEAVSQTFTLGALRSDWVVLPCPPGKVVLGGGVVPTGLGDAPQNVSLVYSGPSDTQHWALKTQNGSVQSVSMTAIATCAKAS